MSNVLDCAAAGAAGESESPNTASNVERRIDLNMIATSSSRAILHPVDLETRRPQKRTSRVSFTANERVRRSDATFASVLRPSLYTTKSSLPPAYSQRSRTLEFSVCALALNWTRLLMLIRGVGVTMRRVLRSRAENVPYGR